MKEQNYVRVNLTNNPATYGEISVPDRVIDKSATILANLLLDFVKNGGNTADITPSNVFGNGRKQ